MEYEKINKRLLPYARCFYCGAKNHIPFDKLNYTPNILVNHVELTEESNFICDKCMEQYKKEE